MKLVVFGLSVSSSWGNGHATLWRGLIGGLAARGHRVVFFERDTPYYARHRDLDALDGCTLVLYRDFRDLVPRARAELSACDAAMVTSYCPDGRAASELVLASRAPVRVYYDLDAPVTLAELARGATVEYLPTAGLGEFDLVLSFTGGRTLDELRRRLGARKVAPLYGSVDPRRHAPVPPEDRFRSDLSYLGTYAADRQAAFEQLVLAAARRLPACKFLVGGPLYPPIDWPRNVWRIEHVAPAEHPAFYGSSRLTLNLTRGAMSALGHCPSGRLFEAAACGAAIVSDWFDGLDEFFRPVDEILIAGTTDDVCAALALSDAELGRVARAGRERTLAQHTAQHRAAELEQLLWRS